MKTTLLVTSFNSLSQLIYTYLKDRGGMVDVVYATSQTRDEEIESFNPELILCPF
jgi:DNA-binding response OmpR family regulator